MTDNRIQAKVLSNAIWNVVNGSSSAVVAIAVPPVLTRMLTPEAYGAWAVALQIGTYMTLFGFGLQMAVGRYVAYAESRGDLGQRDGIVNTAFWFLLAMSLCGWLVICALAIWIEAVLPELSPTLVGETRIAIVLVGLALAINLPASIFAAVFTGQQRSDVPAKIQGLGRVLLAIGLIAAAFSRNLAVLGLVYAVISGGTVLALWHAWRTRTVGPRLSYRLMSRAHGRELAGFCFSLTIWNFSMLLVSGFDLLIVGRWDYAATPYFAVSVTLMAVVAGTITSLANALVPAAASLPDDDGGKSLKDLLLRGSRLVMGASIVVGAPIAFGGYAILQVWLGDTYAAGAAPILTILVCAAMIRNALLPYVTLAIGTGYQRTLTLVPLAEGTVSVLASLLLVQSMGAYGVALAKIIGGFTGITLLTIAHPLKGALGNLSRRDFFVQSVLRPGTAVIPVTVLYWASASFVGDHALAMLFVYGLCSVVSVWFLALSRDDRLFVSALARARLGRRFSRGPV